MQAPTTARESIVIRGADIAIALSGIGLTLYLALATTGFVSYGTLDYYSNFAVVIVWMTALIVVRDSLKACINEPGRRRTFILWVAVAASLCTVISLIYLRWNAQALQITAPMFNATQTAFGFALIVGFVALIWAMWGALLATIALIPILYFFFGHAIDLPLLGTPHYDTGFILNYLSLNIQQGFYYFLPVTTDKLFFMVLFGAVMFGAGILRVAHECGKVVGSRVRGGAAFPAILGSGVVGSVVGQAVANIGLSGSLTIPLMKENGFTSPMAAAIETMASTSGQFMPPLLGLAGFLIAGFLYIPYSQVALRSFIPAVLFLCGIGIAVARYGKATGLSKLTEPVDGKLVARMMPTLILPFALVFFVLWRYQVASWAGMAGIAAACLLTLAQGRYRPSLRHMGAALKQGIELIVALTILGMAVGPIAQVFITTNLSGRLVTQVAVLLPHGKLLLLVIGMIMSLILGMGLPTPLAYLVAALVMVPFLQQLGGVAPLYAHFFVFYFAVFSTVTPPVAVGILAASRIADANFYRAALEAMRMSAVTFIVPFAFVYHPQLLAFPHIGLSVLRPIAEVLLVQWVTAIVVYRHLGRRLPWWEELLGLSCLGLGYWALLTPPGVRLWIFLAATAAMILLSWTRTHTASRAAAQRTF
ncbi:MAG TPA: TRAP transporter large permease subunit [Gammaproteobacteria bacterium]|nr:TRAP transporter large permease subunit [Gammaproteobacteria bacterium]